jgi:hypothetical protein
MADDVKNATHSDEGSELNGKNASFRTAPMISAPSIVLKRRIKGALIPLPKKTP